MIDSRASLIYIDGMLEKIRIGALISGGGSNLQAVIDACDSGEIDGTVVFVGTDNPAAGGLARAERHGIPTFVADYAGIIGKFRDDPEGFELPGDLDLDAVLRKHALFEAGQSEEKIRAFMMTRAASEFRLLSCMAEYSFDLLILAGFMRKLSPYLIDHVNKDPACPRIMNIHPALLPAFPGVDGYGDTFRYGCKVGGCTVHFVDYGEDSGPIIGQRSFAITGEDTLDSIRKKGLALEWELYPECIRLFADGRLKIVTRTHTLDNGRPYSRTVVEIG